MTLRLTPELLAAGYDFLKVSEPFKFWKLPHSSKVKFKVIKTPHYHADTLYDDRKDVTPIVRVSRATVGHTVTLLATLGHEMIHLRQWQIGDSGNHNAFFKRQAARVCKENGFDPLTF